MQQKIDILNLDNIYLGKVNEFRDRVISCKSEKGINLFS